MLLLDGRGLSVPLRHDDAPADCAMFAGHVLPRGLARARRMNLAPGFRRCQEDAGDSQAFSRNRGRPSAAFDTDGRAQIDIEACDPSDPCRTPLEKIRLPLLERAAGSGPHEVDVVRNDFTVVNGTFGRPQSGG